MQLARKPGGGEASGDDDDDANTGFAAGAALFVT